MVARFNKLVLYDSISCWIDLKVYNCNDKHNLDTEIIEYMMFFLRRDGRDPVFS